MALGIVQHGMVRRQDDGTTTIVRPGKSGGPATEIEVPEDIADTYRLATGDVVEGTAVRIMTEEPETGRSDEVMEDEIGWDEQIDEPPAARNASVPVWLATHRFPTERLTNATRINGLAIAEAVERPSARSRRSNSERTPPDRQLTLAITATDYTGRVLDFAAPLGIGCMGVIRGPHGSGLTYTLRSVLNGIVTHAPDCVPMVLLLRARGEEITDWRRQFPQADVVVCSSAFGEVMAEETLLIADLVLEAAQRQTELGRDVVLLVDSLTGLWGSLLEAEEADAQAQADQAQARQRLRAWVQRAGCFHGETPLGGSLGGSLTLIGTVWDQPVDAEAEEERDLHPHLRLMEHLLHETSWRVALSAPLARQRLYPAMDVKACLSVHEERFLSPPDFEALLRARTRLPSRDPLACYQILMEALESTSDMAALIHVLTLSG
ncbi:MAG TPA: hypothetical protein VKU00_20020 [Chthonomonadaceae bacterium]|nr:hypothetical protein [Chthonomonadaceae bacterium]